MNIFVDTFSTPVGAFSVALNASGCVIATAFGDETSLRARTRIDGATFTRDSSACARVRDQVEAYFAGERRDFELPLAAAGTPFQRRVWAALCEIGYGETRTYGELARLLGHPTASRAVGRANATNPICLLVPCHRVVGADGSLTGFAFGETIKRQLLAHEARTRAHPRAA